MVDFDLEETGVEKTALEMVNVPTEESEAALEEIDALDLQLSQHFQDKLQIQPFLTRQLVSFQANKSRAKYRWYKYKEAFSADLVEQLLQRYQIGSGKLLDPFAGSGTALFTAGALEIDADGIRPVVK